MHSTSDSSADRDMQVTAVEAHRVRLERLLQIATGEFNLRLEFGTSDALAEGQIVVGIAPDTVVAATWPVLVGKALHLMGHYLSGSHLWAEAARQAEQEGHPHFSILWHCLEDARVENKLVRCWPGAARFLDTKIPPRLGGRIFGLMDLTAQVEMGLYLEGRGFRGAHYAETVADAFAAVRGKITQAAQGDTPRTTLDTIMQIYQSFALLLRGHSARRAIPDRTQQEIAVDNGPQQGRSVPTPPSPSIPEISLDDDDLFAVGVAGRSRELPEWYQPGSAPWFERGIGDKAVHPSATQPDRLTIIEPPPGDTASYRALRSEIHREAGYMARGLTNILYEEAYLRYAGRFRSGKINMSKLWKQRLGDYQLFHRQTEAPQRVALSLLVDESASMKPQDKYRIAAKAAILMGETLARLQAPFEIIGYTTAEFEARAAMRLGLTPAHEYRTMRCSPLEHRIYKGFAEPYYAVQTRLTGIVPRQNNWDEEHLLFAFRRLQAYPADRKLMIVISDGQPNGNADHLIRTVNHLEDLKCKVIGIGMGGDFVTEIYHHAVVISSFWQLAEEMLQILVAIFRTEKSGRRFRHFDGVLPQAVS